MSELAGSPSEVDRLSDLPEPILLHILSFLPTKFALRVSLLSRRYCCLWTASPSMGLNGRDFPHSRALTSAVSHCLRVRDPSAALVNFSLDSHHFYNHLPLETASNWLKTAYSLGLRNLDLSIRYAEFEALLPLILTFHSLQSLKITTLNSIITRDMLSRYNPSWSSRSDLKGLILEETNLENLCLHPSIYAYLDLKCRTMKTMKLAHQFWKSHWIKLSFPALEVLDLTVRGLYSLENFYAELPQLKKMDLTLPSEESVPLLSDLLKYFKNVSQLSIRIKDLFPKIPELKRACCTNHWEKCQIHPLVAPGKDLPTFRHLRSLKLWVRFHEGGISDLICFLQSAPVLESIELHHVAEGGCRWKSRLPPDSEGNNEHVHFSNLHLGNRKIELIRRLLATCNERHQKKLKIMITSKRRRG